VTKLCTLPLLAGEMPTVASSGRHRRPPRHRGRRASSCSRVVALPGRVEGDVVEVAELYSERPGRKPGLRATSGNPAPGPLLRPYASAVGCTASARQRARRMPDPCSREERRGCRCQPRRAPARMQTVEPQAREPRHGELDRERHAVECATNVADALLIRSGHRPAGSCQALDKQGNRVGLPVVGRQRQRRNREHPLERHHEPGPASRQNRQAWARLSSRSTTGAAPSTTCSQLSRASRV
jgi:hypothetical protein